MPAVLALDLGKSASRAALWLAGPEPITISDGPGTAGLASPAGLAAAEAVIGVLWNRLRAGLGSTVTGPVALCVGAAGATAAGEAAAGLA
ncbi:MAG: ATPase, partial [Jatrophihabitantaceae bacterium]